MGPQIPGGAPPSSATGLSPFQCAYGYQPPLFPDLEPEVAVPSAQAFVRLSTDLEQRSPGASAKLQQV